MAGGRKFPDFGQQAFFVLVGTARTHNVPVDQRIYKFASKYGLVLQAGYLLAALMALSKQF